MKPEPKIKTKNITTKHRNRCWIKSTRSRGIPAHRRSLATSQRTMNKRERRKFSSTNQRQAPPSGLRGPTGSKRSWVVCGYG
ncbi:hypothetical protein T484DRAFT_3190091 [Baffinella frigidus]|nr:hypothetical protein T484DRAFT_3190091 [Cryptophyta sp. CCMP2293]